MRMNYNRPVFKRQKVWEGHDQYESAGQFHRRGIEEGKSLASSSLDMMLLSYDGPNERLCRLRTKSVEGRTITTGDSRWAFNRLTALASASAAVSQLTELGCACPKFADLLATSVEVLKPGQVKRLDTHALACGRVTQLPEGVVRTKRVQRVLV